MTLHKEGKTIIATALLLWAVSVSAIFHFHICIYLSIFLYTLLSVVLFLIIWFFRIPNRIYTTGENKIICPADGKIVVIEDTFEPEYLKTKCKQVSVFMSPLNVHVNRYPISGSVSFYKYHPGKYLVAWHPKASELNERTTIVLKTSSSKEILIRQIAGALARRIVCYSPNHTQIAQNQELGFIKFGSRVDLFLPLDAKINVKIGDIVKGGQTVIADL